jgi:hypothetical protein
MTTQSTRRTFATQFTGSVDKTAGIIRGVAVITAGIAKGHGEEVDAVTLSQVAECARSFAGGLKVVDRHTKSSDSIFSTTGTLRNFRVEDGKVRADLHILATEPNRDKLLEMAETMPDTFGLSIAFSGPTETRDGRNFARCAEIYNAALVDVPAANPTGLFSANVEVETEVKVDATGAGNFPPTMTPDEILKQCGALIASATTELASRLANAETKLSAMEGGMKSATNAVTECSAKIDGAVKEFAAKLGDENKRIELTAQTVAKEFAKNVGTSAGVRTDGAAGNGTPPAPSAADTFEATAKKHFAATKSQAKAFELSIAEDPKGYAAFRAANRDLKFA